MLTHGPSSDQPRAAPIRLVAGAQTTSSDGTVAHLTLIGGFALQDGGAMVEVAPVGQRLMALLALDDRPLPRSRVASQLWLDVPEERAAASLRSALWRLPQPDGTSLVTATSTHLALAARVRVDYRAATAAAARLRRPDTAEVEVSPEAFARDLLPGWYEDWVLVERERFRQVRLHALEALAGRLAHAGRFDDAVQAGLAAVAGEPLRESAHRRLIQVYLAEGNPGEALRHFRWCWRLLTTELGVEPSADLRRLVAHLLR